MYVRLPERGCVALLSEGKGVVGGGINRRSLRYTPRVREGCTVVLQGSEKVTRLVNVTGTGWGRRLQVDTPRYDRDRENRCRDCTRGPVTVGGGNSTESKSTTGPHTLSELDGGSVHG